MLNLISLETMLFAVLPYLAFTVFLLQTVQRYRSETFTYSSLSSQFLENQHHFWGIVPFHYGIITILTGHAIAFLVPGSVLAWNSRPIRLYVLEVMLLTCGILTVVGLFNLIVRRAGNPMTRATSSPTDWILLAFLAGQVAIGIYIAVFKGWGSSWFAAAASPYLWSLAKLKPDVTYISGLPWIVKTHILNSFIIIALFPFTRLVHILVVPNPYLWRKQQMVRWYWDRKHIR